MKKTEQESEGEYLSEQESKEKNGNPSRRDSDPIEEKPIQEKYSKLDTMKVQGCTKGELRREKLRRLFKTHQIEWEGIFTKFIVIAFLQAVFFVIATLTGVVYNYYLYGFKKVLTSQVVIGIIILDIIALILWKFFYSKEKSK